MAWSPFSSSDSRAARRARVAAPRYWRATREPLYCLVFLLPLVAAYELGLAFWAPRAWAAQQLVAHVLLQRVLGFFGGAGYWLPGLALAATLLIWHAARGGRWRVRAGVFPLMLGESLLLALPLVALTRALLQTNDAPGASTGERVFFALGAAVYEELVFRLYLIAGLTWLATRVFEMPRRYAAALAVALAAIVFGLCHFQPVGGEPFVWRRFGTLFLAGIYLSIVFVGRGLGIATGCHAAFNLLVLLG